MGKKENEHVGVCVAAKSLHTYQLVTVSIKIELMLTRLEPRIRRCSITAQLPPPRHRLPFAADIALVLLGFALGGYDGLVAVFRSL